MLVVKLVEAVIRIFGGVGFHQSRHVVDSGLFGASGLAGCCGSRKARRSHRPHRSTDVPRVTSSQISLHRPQNQKSQLGATPTDSTPPSVLRPEHAYQPYREESDDEEGFIMGAWNSSPRGARYSAVEAQPPPEPPKKSGFSRVGGGRSNFETPYAIQAGSTATFPSVGGQSATNSLAPRRASPPITTPTMANAARKTLPPGAMPPHIRTKSQTAVIENPAVLAAIASTQKKPPAFRRVSDDDMSLEIQPKKKPWYQKLKARRHSDGNMSMETNSEYIPSEPAPAAPPSSFVVVRKGQQPAASSSETAGASGSGGEQPAPKKSFVVLRE